MLLRLVLALAVLFTFAPASRAADADLDPAFCCPPATGNATPFGTDPGGTVAAIVEHGDGTLTIVGDAVVAGVQQTYLRTQTATGLYYDRDTRDVGVAGGAVDDGANGTFVALATSVGGTPAVRIGAWPQNVSLGSTLHTPVLATGATRIAVTGLTAVTDGFQATGTLTFGDAHTEAFVARFDPAGEPVAGRSPPLVTIRPTGVTSTSSEDIAGTGSSSAIVGAASGPGGDTGLVARLNGGALDPAFDTDGVATPAVDALASVLLQADGTITTVGTKGSSLAVTRLGPAGAVDAAFGSGGLVTRTVPGVPTQGTALAQDVTRRLIVGGRAGGTGVVARLAGDGSADPGFPGAGAPLRTLDLGDGTATTVAAIGAQASAADRLLVAGTLRPETPGTGTRHYLVRLGGTTRDPFLSGIGGPDSLKAGTKAAYTVSASDGDGGALSYGFDLDDAPGHELTQASPTASFSSTVVGPHVIGAFVQDSSGVRAYATKAVTVTENAKPTAKITGPTAGIRSNGPLTLDGSGSSDDEAGLAFQWTVDGQPASTQPQLSVSSQFPKRDYAVKLTVTDPAGQSATATTELHFTSNPPNVTASATPATQKAGQTLVVALQGSFDPDGYGAIAGAEVDIDKDGAYDAKATGPVPNVPVKVPSLPPGSRTLKVRVYDNEGDATVKEVAFAVAGELPPKVTVKPDAPRPSSSLSFDFSKSTSAYPIAQWCVQIQSLTCSKTTANVEVKPLKGPPVTTTYPYTASQLDADLTAGSVTAAVTVTNAPPKGVISLFGSAVVPKQVGSTADPVKASCQVKAKSGCAAFSFSNKSVKPSPPVKPNLAGVSAKPIAVEAGRPLFLQAASLSDPEGAPHYVKSLEWDFDYDGKTFTSDTGTPRLDVATTTTKLAANLSGTRVIALRITDEEGAATIVTQPITITAATLPTPVITVQTDSFDDQGRPLLKPFKSVTFSSAGSASFETASQKVDWDLGGLERVKGEFSSPVIDARALKPGLYTVTLKVTDKDGKSASVSVQVHAEKNLPPVLTLSEPQPSAPGYGEPVTLTADYADADGGKFTPDLKWGYSKNGKKYPVTGSGGGAQTFEGLPEGPVTLWAAATDGDGAYGYAEKSVTVLPPKCEKVLTSGPVALTAVGPTCFRNRPSVSSEADATVDVVEIDGVFRWGGLRFEPLAGAHATLIGYRDKSGVGGVRAKLYGGSVRISSGDLTLYQGPTGLALTGDGRLRGAISSDFKTLVDIPTPGGQKVAGLRLAGITTPTLSDGTFAADAILALPDQLGGQTGKVPLAKAISTRAEGLQGYTFEVDGGALGILGLKQIKVVYQGSNTFAVTADVALPSVGAAIGGNVGLDDGSLVSAGLKFEYAPGIPIGTTGALLNRIEVSLDLSQGVSAAGLVKLTAADVIGVTGQVHLDFPDQGPWHIGADAGVDVLGTAFGNANLDYYSNGYIKLGGEAKFSDPTGVSAFKGTLNGEYYSGAFNLEGKGAVCILDGCFAKGRGLVSSIGAAFCLSFKINLLVGTVTWHPGFGITYKPIDFTPYLSGCDVDDFRAIVKPTRGTRAATSASFDLPKGLPGEVVEITGAAAPPDVVLTGPDGTTVSTAGRAAGDQDAHSVVLRDRLGLKTIVLLLGPAAGTWKVDGTMTGLRVADGLLPPKVSGSVTGHSRLRYEVGAGLSVRFIEQGNRTGKVIGTARGTSGTLRFTPAPGAGGRRTIVAEVSQNGTVRGIYPVTTYRAPATEHPRKPRVRVRSGSARWGRDQAATRGWRVRVTLSDGTRIDRILPASAHSLALPRASAGAVTVRGVGADQRTGPTGRGRYGRTVRKLKRVRVREVRRRTRVRSHR